MFMPADARTLAMSPPTGERLVRFVGDRIRFELRPADGRALPDGWRAWLRTNLGRGPALQRELIHSRGGERPLTGASWRDVPMQREGDGWIVELALTEVGHFQTKAYAADERGFQVWPDGPDFGLSVHPDGYRTANTIYSAFTRLFGDTKRAARSGDAPLESKLKRLEKLGYAVLPPSGKLRDLIPALPHIVDTLGCRILQLLPINPTPTTYARMGRFGSPYAGLDLTAIDPALVEFDQRTTGVDQFRELTYAVHAKGARLFLDLVINHTGWSSTLHEQHPEWFARNPDGSFQSPGAWGVTWEDLVDLDEAHHDLWDVVADAFLTWCRRGVDGFRCDAGYKIPMPVWQYTIARVRQEFPDTVFLLEGLGGAWHDTETLLTEGGMQWAYSELFQEFSGVQVAGYLDHALKQSQRAGVLVHYSETHDNERLAKQGRKWSLLRNRLCALAGVSGGFGFTCGVEWLATERIRVHGCTGLAWGSADNIVPELGRLNRLLADHPCFFDGARLTRLSRIDSPVFALGRDSAEGKDRVLVLVNTDVEKPRTLTLAKDEGPSGESWVDLLGQPLPTMTRAADGEVSLKLDAGACYCLSDSPEPRGWSGATYRRARAQAAFAVQALRQTLEPEDIGPHDWPALAALVNGDPQAFLAALPHLDRAQANQDLVAALNTALAVRRFPKVITWELPDRRRVTLVPPGHWLLVRDPKPFRVSLQCAEGPDARHAEAIGVDDGFVACFPPLTGASDAELVVERYAEVDGEVRATVRFLPLSIANRQSPIAKSQPPIAERRAPSAKPQPPIADRQSAIRNPQSGMVLLTNGRGGMARLCVDLGRVNSKYDCLLGANLDAEVPVDRHIFAKRVRVWAVANGFISPLNADNLAVFAAGPPARWTFRANAGDGRTAGIVMTAGMIEGQNTTVLAFGRESDDVLAVPEIRGAEYLYPEVSHPRADSLGVSPHPDPLPIGWREGRRRPGEGLLTFRLGRPENSVPPIAVRLTVRVDIEDRNFHEETRHNGGADRHFAIHTQPLPDRPGFAFTPAQDRQLRVFASAGAFHPQPEWCENIPHPVEATRGQVASGDAYSPGWFDLPLAAEGPVQVVVTAEVPPEPAQLSTFNLQPSTAPGTESDRDDFGHRLRRAAQAFIVRRGEGKTVIAGYPWFLNWGRDTLICARGLLAAGMAAEVKQGLITFGRFEKEGTLPNSIHGNDASNRDTSDAPLWYGIVCEELADGERAFGLPPAVRGSFSAAPGPVRAAGQMPASAYRLPVDPSGRTIADVLRSIAVGYLRGTPNGVRMDAESALVWSPSHFTWMDTNHPAGTPREGYPIEIQALWIRLLRQLERLGAKPENGPWGKLVGQAEASLHDLFWLEHRGWFADVLVAPPGMAAREAVPSDALRSNCLLPVSLGLVTGERARRCVEAALRHLVVPGALRSLAPLPVTPPLEVRGRDGRLLNDPANPYCGRYEGDEDTQRKPAYHNGTAWTWTLPIFCEALVRAWDASPEAVAAAKSYLGSLAQLLDEGCLGQIPEILDGDAPHAARGCDAQAWGVTEALRVWSLLG
jgi:glycogen debranching enzyme